MLTYSITGPNRIWRHWFGRGGLGFPLARLESRLKCPRCGSRRVVLLFEPPSLGARTVGWEVKHLFPAALCRREQPHSLPMIHANISRTKSTDFPRLEALSSCFVLS